MRAAFVLALLVAQFVASQSLPPCANECVNKTKTKCKPTDFVCACSDGKYIPRLTTCIDKTCDAQSQLQAHGYLASLCEAVGYPIEGSKAQAGAIAEMLDLAHVPPKKAFIVKQHIVERQIDSALPSLSSNRTRTPISTGTAAASRTAPGGTTGTTSSDSNNDNGATSGGLSTGAKIGLGVGIPLGIGLMAGLVTLGFFLRRRNKGQESTANAQPHLPDAPGITQPPYKPGASGLAELDQNAQYVGQEMPTKHNTAEMSVGSPQPGYALPVHGWQQGQQPQAGQHQFPQHGQLGQGLYAQPMQQHYPPPGQHWTQQVQPSPAELPERMQSPQQ